MPRPIRAGAFFPPQQIPQMETKIIRKRFDLKVDQSGQSVRENFQLEKTITQIKGITLTSDQDQMIYFRGSQKIEIGGEEVFPEDYETKLLMTGISLRPDQRFFPLDLQPGNGIVSITFKDTLHPSAAFVPYRVSLYLEVVA